MSIEYRPPRSENEIEESFQCVCKVFDIPKEDMPFVSNVVLNDPRFSIDNTRSCFLNGKVVSTLQVFNLPMRIGNCIVRMGGIGRVVTDPDHRRQGFSSYVLKDSVRYMQSLGYDISVLGTGSQFHYAKHGWVIFSTYNTSLKLPETIDDSTNGLIIEPSVPDRDLADLMSIYDQFNMYRTGSIYRSEEYWKNRLRWVKSLPFFWVAKRNDKIIAYLRADNRNLLEFAFVSGEEKAAKVLFSNFFKELKKENIKTIHAACPSDLQFLFKELGCRIERNENQGVMIRIINFEILLKKISPLLEERLRNSPFSGWEGSIRISYEANNTTLLIKDGRATLSEIIHPPTITLSLSQTQLLKLLLGNLKTEHIAFSNNLNLDDREIGLLDTMFPSDEFLLWNTDGF